MLVRTRTLSLGAAAIFGPAVLLAIYLLLSRHLATTISAGGDWAAIAVSVAVGAIPFWRIVPRVSSAAIYVAAYVAVSLVLLGLFGVGFVCGVFGDCL